MTERSFRAYELDLDGHIVGRWDLVGCACDNEARQLVSHRANGQPIELWKGARLVERFPPAAGDREGWLHPPEAGARQRKAR